MCWLESLKLQVSTKTTTEQVMIPTNSATLFTGV
uniref:Uncharacterized protein n=1 Tax=Arundo donax TaxID=35708 RepID=A0A0A9AGD3_ARUDO